MSRESDFESVGRVGLAICPESGECVSGWVDGFRSGFFGMVLTNCSLHGQSGWLHGMRYRLGYSKRLVTQSGTGRWRSEVFEAGAWTPLTDWL